MDKLNKAILYLLTALTLFTALTSTAFAANGKKGKTDGERIVAFAKKYEGCSYVHGTRGPNTFDCSGFVYFVFRHFKVTLSASSSDYYSSPKNFGKIVKESKAKPGDVISWRGHVGIYIGKGKVLHALNPRKGVCITKVSEFIDRYGESNPKHHYIRIDIRTKEEKAAEAKAKKAAKAAGADSEKAKTLFGEANLPSAAAITLEPFSRVIVNEKIKTSCISRIPLSDLAGKTRFSF